MNNQNLDRVCAQFGFQMAEKVYEAFLKSSADTENLITKSLGVLQENGLYAFFLYLSSQIKEGREEKKSSKGARPLANIAAGLLANVGLLVNNPELLKPDGYRQAMEQIRQKGGLADNLDNLLFAKYLLEQALIYARYHAKALGG